MKCSSHWIVALAAFLSLSAIARADEAGEKLDAAKTSRAQAVKSADAALVTAFDDQIKSLAGASKMEDLKAVLGQRDEFNKTHTLPSVPAMAPAVDAYRKSMKAENAKLAAAFDEAIRQRNKDMKVEDAAELRQEREKLLSGEGAAVTPTGDAIYDRLQQAKADHDKTVANAKQKLLDVIEARMSAAADAGDLKKVKSLQAAKASVAAENKVGDIKDSTITGAAAQRDQTIKTADKLLAKAYDDAIAGYVKARKIPDAEAVQAERQKVMGDAGTGAGGSDTGDSEPVRLDKFTSRSSIPAYLRSSDKASITKDGLTFSEREGTIRTRDGKFLDQDFTFDVVYEQVASDERKNAITRIGIGEGSFAGGYGEPQNSAFLRIEAPNGDGVVEFVKNGMGSPIKVTKATDPGTHMVRIEKHGDAVTVSYCLDFKGTFTADATQTIPNIRQYAPFLNKTNTYLFINGGGIYKGVRLVHSDSKKSE